MEKVFLRTHLRILLVWLCVMAVLYVAADRYLKPTPLVITASGELVIQRARDGHFRAPGSVNGRPVNFMVDTGASLVVVSEAFARQAGLPAGEPTTFSTANGNMPGHTVRNVPVSVGPIDVSGIRVGVGLLGLAPDEALLGQNFLSRFEVLISNDRMILRKK
jgi:aspartyl protease family protein